MQVSIIDGTISEIIQHSYRLAQNHCCPWDIAMKSNMIDNNVHSSGPTSSGMALRKVFVERMPQFATSQKRALAIAHFEKVTVCLLLLM